MDDEESASSCINNFKSMLNQLALIVLPLEEGNAMTLMGTQASL